MSPEAEDSAEVDVTRKEPSVHSCASVRDLTYPLLLRTLPERERREVLEHAAQCDSCRVTIEAVRSRLTGIPGVPALELDERPKARRRGPRWRWPLWLPILPAALAYWLLLVQGLQVARYQQQQRFLARVQRALLAYRLDFGDFPPGNGVPLAAFLGSRERGGPYLDLGHERLDGSGHFLDAWGERWVYRYPGARDPRLFELWSYGANGRDDGGKRDDIASWD
jgi:hypothetical protein